MGGQHPVRPGAGAGAAGGGVGPPVRRHDPVRPGRYPCGWGHGFEIFGFRAFSDLQVGFRSSGNFGNEARIDGTLGIWAFEPLLLLFQSFTAATPARIGQVAYLSQKAQVSAVYWLTPSVGLQVGGLFALRGVNSDAERGVFSALWVKF